MIQRLKVIVSDELTPYHNLALEEYLLNHVEACECILYLWQNRSTVVIGKNQNAWKECRVEGLEQDGGYLARRMSGGGAVFHDLGNLNFTFVVKKDDYSVDLQSEVILKAVQVMGVKAQHTGRNDLTVEGMKFSGNAFYQSGENCFHHGTILIKVNKTDMSRYLNVSKSKLESKGVESVKSRITNLSEFNPSVTIDGMKEQLISSFAGCYGFDAVTIQNEEIDWAEVTRLEQRFSSWEWKYGRKIPFNFYLENRYSWGDVEAQIHVDLGKIRQIKLYSDALDTELIQTVETALTGVIYRTYEIRQRLEERKAANRIQEKMIEDMKTLFCDSMQH